MCKDLRKVVDNLEESRIFVAIIMGLLCNEGKYKEALVFQSVRDNLANSIQLLKDYDVIYKK